MVRSNLRVNVGTFRRRRNRASAADEYLFATQSIEVADEAVGCVALRARDFGRCDEQLKIERTTELEKNREVVGREAIGFVEK